MSSPQVEMLDFASPDVHAAAAGRLYHLEIDRLTQAGLHRSQLSEHRLAMIMGGSYDSTTSYGLIEPHVGVLAAASVIHARQSLASDKHGPPLTHIFWLAVHPDVRHQCHGREIVKHIARQALEHGDSQLEYFLGPDHALPNARGFLKSLGFYPEDHSTIAHYASALELVM